MRHHASRKFWAYLLLLCVAMAGCADKGDYERILQLRDNLQLDPHDVDSLSALIGYLDDSHWLDPANAAGCFRQLASGPRNKEEVVPVIGPLVVHHLVKNAEKIGREATNALTEYGTLVGPYKAELVSIMQKHPDEDIAWFAVEALGNLGPGAADVLSEIERLPVYETWDNIREEAIRKIRAQQSATDSATSREVETQGLVNADR